MFADDLYQVWSFCDGQIVRIIASDFTICLYDETESEAIGVMELHDEQQHLSGDIRGHYRNTSGAYWKRIA